MSSRKPVIHGRDHLPGGADPIPSLGGGGVPSIATFWFNDSADYVTVPPTSLAHLATDITWANASLPSSGEVSGPDAFNNINFEKDCITIEWLQTQWDDAGYLKAAVLGADSRIVEADQYGLGNAGDGTSGAGATGLTYGDSTSVVRPNIHLANDKLQVYANQEDTVSHQIVSAYLVLFIWSIDGLGYDGSIPGWPA